MMIALILSVVVLGLLADKATSMRGIARTAKSALHQPTVVTTSLKATIEKEIVTSSADNSKSNMGKTSNFKLTNEPVYIFGKAQGACLLLFCDRNFSITNVVEPIG
jgi:hypothetical protein